MANRILGRNGSGLMTTTKAELLKLLDRYDYTQLLAFCYNYGDHSRTVAIEGIRTAEEVTMRETAYSPSGFAVAPDREPEEDCGDVYWPEGQEEPPTVVVLS